MADTYTTNLNLKKPGYDSPADIKDLNDNFDKIDTSVNQLSEQIANKTYNLNVSATSNKVELANCTLLSCVGNIGYYRLSFHVTEQVDNREVIFTITGFHKELFFADAFIAMGIDKVFFSAGCSIAGNTMSLVSNAGNDVGHWFHMPVIVFFKD